MKDTIVLKTVRENLPQIIDQTLETNHRFGDNNRTILHLICQSINEKTDFKKFEEDLRKLMILELDINAQDSYGATALHIATRRAKKSIIKLLLDNGAKAMVMEKYHKMYCHEFLLPFYQVKIGQGLPIGLTEKREIMVLFDGHGVSWEIFLSRIFNDLRCRKISIEETVFFVKTLMSMKVKMNFESWPYRPFGRLLQCTGLRQLRDLMLNWPGFKIDLVSKPVRKIDEAQEAELLEEKPEPLEQEEQESSLEKEAKKPKVTVKRKKKVLAESSVE